VGDKGDLFELIDEAPVNLRTFQATLWTWRHHERARQAVEASVQHTGGSVAHMMVGSGPIEETSDTHEQIAIQLPNRWRIDGTDRIEISDGSSRWVGRSGHITHLTSDQPDIDSTELGPMIHPGAFLFGQLQFAMPGIDQIAGRDTWRVEARPNTIRAMGRPIPMTLGGIEQIFWFDAETGIVLRHVGLFEEQPCTIHEFSNLSLNQPLGEEMFQYDPRPGEKVETQADQLLRMADHRGIDLGEVDRKDPKSIQAALSASMRGQPTTEQMAQRRRDKHVPVGAPPADQAEARHQIEYAFGHLDEVGADGTTLVNVQSGEKMADLLTQARRRLPNSDPTAVKTVVDDVLFLRSDAAVIWFGIEVDGQRFPMVNGREGRAVLLDDRWLVERATVVDLLGFAGVSYPPNN
jgi:outer membrane lipoprotein-sorting protein